MAAPIVIELLGHEQLQRILQAVGQQAAPVIDAATRSGGQIIANEAKRLAPFRSGSLRRSITVRKVPGASGEPGYVVGPTEPYGLYVEYGTGIFNTQGGGRMTPWTYRAGDGSWVTTRGNRPQPYLRPAFSAKQAEALQEISDAVVALVTGAAP